MSDTESTKKEESRYLRDRKDRKLYNEEWVADEQEESDEFEDFRGFRLEEKIESDQYSHSFVKELEGHNFTLAYVQKYGFHYPVIFRDKAGLGLRVPTQDFTVTHVKMCVGSRRVVDVMDVASQKNQQMTMKEWVRYYNEPEKDKLLNVISLEFSHTKLEDYIQTPTIVRQLDWVDTIWPRSLKESQTEATNSIDDMMYPKVQKYCLMSVKGCYTDFHIDFGGSSVWYHVLKGSKIFWLIPPTEKNLVLYENWVLSGKQSDIFFGDTVEKCSRIRLVTGNTFFIPSGWIHAVYTPQDSLVFGGNFLHSYSITRQLHCARIENATHVPQKHKYPFYTEMLWYTLQKYVYCLLGRNHLEVPQDEIESPPSPSTHIHLTAQELHGMKNIVLYLHQLPSYRKNIPELIKDPIALIKDVRTLVEFHRGDSPELAITGRNVLTGVEDCDVRPRDRFTAQKQEIKMKCPPQYADSLDNKVKNLQKLQGGPRRRRTRCKKCEACQRSDCGECSFCLDMVKFGGPGRAKQTCVMRQCLQPMLPVTAACAMCELDGWGQPPVIPIQKVTRDTPSSLMECSVCYDIAHPACYTKSHPGIDGVLNEDLPNSWECPRCCKAGRNREYRPRHFRARQKSSEVRRMSYNSDPMMEGDNRDVEVDSDSDSCSRPNSPDGTKRIKVEDRSSEGSSVFADKTSRSPDNALPQTDPRKMALRTQLAQQLIGQSNRVLKKPIYVVRPSPMGRPQPPLPDGNPVLERKVMVPIFRYLNQKELVGCALVCRSWARYSLDPSLWKRMDMSHKRLTACHLAGIVRRQPEELILDWCYIAKKQLGWLLSRLPQMRSLSVQGCSWPSVSALCSCTCPPLTTINLSFVGNLNDSSLRDILSPPSDSRPGMSDNTTRLRHVKCLKIAGSDISDVSLRYITQHLPRLAVLDVSSCTRITDAGIAQLTTPSASTLDTLTSLDLSNVRSITDLSLEHLSRCLVLSQLNISHTPHITAQGVSKFQEKRDDPIEIIGKG